MRDRLHQACDPKEFWMVLTSDKQMLVEHQPDAILAPSSIKQNSVQVLFDGSTAAEALSPTLWSDTGHRILAGTLAT